MKITLLLFLFCLVPLLLAAGSLTELARRERERREAQSASRRGAAARAYTDADLERYRQLRASAPEPGPTRPVVPSRDLTRERAHWRGEKEKLERELARLDAGLRRLEWRLEERKARRRPGLREDPTDRVLRDSLAALREERAQLVEAFHERGRKAGALPGWLR